MWSGSPASSSRFSSGKATNLTSATSSSCSRNASRGSGAVNVTRNT